MAAMLALPLALAACSPKDGAEEPAFYAGKTYTITSAPLQDEPQQGPNKVHINNIDGSAVHLVWDANDKISQLMDVVLTGGDKVQPATFTLKSVDETGKASFTGPARYSGDDYYVIYPASDSYRYANKTGSGSADDRTIIKGIEIPETQTYVAGNYAPNTMPMVGRGTAGNFSITAVGSVLAFRLISSSSITVNQVEVEATRVSLCGNFDYNTENKSLTYSGDGTAGGTTIKLVGINQTLSDGNGELTCYAVLPPGTYSGITLYVYLAGGVIRTKSFSPTNGLSLTANKVKLIKSSQNGGAYDIAGWN